MIYDFSRSTGWDLGFGISLGFRVSQKYLQTLSIILRSIHILHDIGVSNRDMGYGVSELLDESVCRFIRVQRQDFLPERDLE